MPTLASTKKKNTKDKGQRKEAPKVQRQQPQEALPPNVEPLEEQTKTENESQKEGPGDLEEYSSEQTVNPIDSTHGAVQGGVVEEELVSVSKGSGLNEQVMFFIEKLQKENVVIRNKLEEQKVRLEEQNVRLEELNKELKEQKVDLEEQNANLKNQNTRLEELNKELKEQKADLEEQNATLKNQNIRLDKLNKELKEQKADLEEQNATLKNQNIRLEEQNKELKEQKADLEEQNANLKNQNIRLEEQNVRLEELNKELKEQKADLEEQNANMKNRISVLERDMKRMSLEMDMMKRSFDTVLSLDTEEQLSNSIANCCVRNCPLKLRYGI